VSPLEPLDPGVSWQINRDREVSRRHVRRLLARHRPQDAAYEPGPQDAGPQDAAPPPVARKKDGWRCWVTSLSPFHRGEESG